MARMHSRKHGRSGSKKPIKRIRQEWLSYDKEEVEKIVAKLAKEGKPSAQIGLILRDQYGIPDIRVFNTRVTKIMEKSARKEVPEDLYNLLSKAVLLHRHRASHKADAKATHGLELLESKIRRLGKYYARTGRLPRDWKYSIEQARLLVK
jgi:small subunit ribosomal protein S15